MMIVYEAEIIQYTCILGCPQPVIRGGNVTLTILTGSGRAPVCR